MPYWSATALMVYVLAFRVMPPFTLIPFRLVDSQCLASSTHAAVLLSLPRLLSANSLALQQTDVPLRRGFAVKEHHGLGDEISAPTVFLAVRATESCHPLSGPQSSRLT